MKMEANATWTLPKTDLASNRSLFFYKGESLSIDGKRVSVEHTIRIRPDQDIQVQNGPQDAYMLILQGRPINEPVVKHGPFVMNTEEEIRETMKEYGKTEFGGWPWSEREVAHPRSKGRFALHSDGTEELK